jgi:hypothetical protein
MCYKVILRTISSAHFIPVFCQLPDPFFRRYIHQIVRGWNSCLVITEIFVNLHSYMDNDSVKSEFYLMTYLQPDKMLHFVLDSYFGDS